MSPRKSEQQEVNGDEDGDEDAEGSGEKSRESPGNNCKERGTNSGFVGFEY